MSDDHTYTKIVFQEQRDERNQCFDYFTNDEFDYNEALTEEFKYTSWSGSTLHVVYLECNAYATEIIKKLLKSGQVKEIQEFEFRDWCRVPVQYKMTEFFLEEIKKFESDCFKFMEDLEESKQEMRKDIEQHNEYWRRENE
jgi:hypothetical protein